MPEFSFTDPSGATHKVTGPEGATPEQAFQVLQSKLKAEGSPHGAEAAAKAPAGLVPALKDSAGNVTPGQAGDHHDDIPGPKAEGNRGFINEQGQFEGREAASTEVRAKGFSVPDKLHSQDLEAIGDMARGLPPRDTEDAADRAVGAVTPQQRQAALEHGVHLGKPAGEERSLPVKTQTLYDMQANDVERARVLRDAYGDGAVKRDQKGLYLLLDGGRKVYPKSSLASTALSSTAPVVGGALGAMGGAAIGGPLAAMAGGGAGAAAGQGVNDAVSKIMGYYDRTMPEEAAGLAGQAAAAAGGEFAGRVIPGLIMGGSEARRLAGKAVQSYAGVDSAKVAEARPIIEGGYGINPNSVATVPRVGREIELAAKFQKPYLEKEAQRFASDRAVKVLMDGGMPEAAAQAKVAELKKGMFTPSAEPAGMALKGAAGEDAATKTAAMEAEKADILAEERAKGERSVAEHQSAVAQAQAAAQEHAATMDREIREGFREIEAIKRKPASDSAPRGVPLPQFLEGSEIARKVPAPADKAPRVPKVRGSPSALFEAKFRDLKTKIMNDIGRIYDMATSSAGEHRISIEPAQEAVMAFLQDIPEELQKSTPPLIRIVEKMGGENGGAADVTFGELRHLRTMLREAGYSDKMTTNFRNGALSKLAGVVDTILQDQAKVPELREAVKIANYADSVYAKHMKQFNSVAMQKIVDDVRDGLPMDADKLVYEIVGKGQSSTLQRILSIGGEPLRVQLRNADLKAMMTEAKRDVGDEILGETRTKRVNGQILQQLTHDPNILAEQIEARDKNGTLRMLYGKDAETIAAQGRRLAARGGTLPPEGIAPGRLREALIGMNRATDRIEALAKIKPMQLMDAAMAEAGERAKIVEKAFGKERKNDILGFLASPQQGAAEAAKRILGSHELLAEAISRYGEDSPAIKAIRETAIDRALTPILRPQGPSGREAVTAFQGMTKEMQVLLFPNGMADDLTKIMKGVHIILGDASQTAASIGAGAVLGASPLKAKFPFVSTAYFRQKLTEGLAYVATRNATARFLAADFSKGAGGRQRGMLKLQAISDHLAQAGRAGGSVGASRVASGGEGPVSDRGELPPNDGVKENEDWLSPGQPSGGRGPDDWLN